jgi:hypothetical protein
LSASARSRASFFFVVPATVGIRINTFYAPAGVRRDCGAGGICKTAGEFSFLKASTASSTVELMAFLFVRQQPEYV